MDPSALIAGEDIHAQFDPEEYFGMYRQGFSAYAPGLPEFFLKQFHTAFSSLSSGSLSVLDYGSGPSILGAISAAPVAKEIVLSDFVENNRIAVEKWLAGDSKAFDWTSYFKYVINDLEGLGSEKVKEREELIRNKVKAVVACDVNKHPPIEEEYCREYDVVMCCLVLQCATQSKAEFEAGMKRLATLVKPGGLFLFVGVIRTAEVGFYVVANKRFRSYGVSHEMAKETMEKAGFSDIKQESIPAKNDDKSVQAYFFMQGKKM